MPNCEHYATGSAFKVVKVKNILQYMKRRSIDGAAATSRSSGSSLGDVPIPQAEPRIVQWLVGKTEIGSWSANPSRIATMGGHGGFRHCRTVEEWPNPWQWWHCAWPPSRCVLLWLSPWWDAPQEERNNITRLWVQCSCTRWSRVAPPETLQLIPDGNAPLHRVA